MYNFFHHRYYIVCNHPRFSQSISSRCRAIRELVAKEKEYRAFLQAFPTNVFPEFEKRKDLFCGAAKFPKGMNPLKAIMDGLPAITRLHTDGIGKALEDAPDYLSLLGDKLTQWMSPFFVYDTVISGIRVLQNAMNRLKGKAQQRNVSCDERFKCRPFASNLRLIEVLGRLFQRPMQIRLTLSEILKHTPEYHPDYRGMCAALRALDKTIADLDSGQESENGDFVPVELQPFVRDLTQSPSRRCLARFAVRVSGSPHDLVVLRGVLVLVGPLEGVDGRSVTQFPLLDSRVERVTPSSMALTYSGHSCVTECASAATCEAACAVVRAAHAEMGGNQLSLNWQPVGDPSLLPALAGHAMFYARNALWIYGSRDRGGMLSDLVYHIARDRFEARAIAGDRPPPRDDEVLVVAGTEDAKLFAITRDKMREIPTTGIPPLAQFGRRKNANGPADQLATAAAVLDGNRVFVFGDRFSMRVYTVEMGPTKQWRALDGNAQAKFVPVSNYALCIGNDSIWLHGGITSHDKVEDSLYEVQVIGTKQKRRVSFAMPKSLASFVVNEERDVPPGDR
jgi:hypothetical protein